MKETLEICVWKLIAEKDKDKPLDLRTLDPAKECYRCYGTDYNCRRYCEEK
jgi:hypothetical protein